MKKLVILTIAAMLFSLMPVANAGALTDFAVSDDTLAVSTAVDLTFTWTTVGAETYADGDTVELYLRDNNIPTRSLIGSLLDAASADVDFDSDASNDGAFTFPGTGRATYTIATASAVTQATKSLSVKIPALDAGVYSVGVVDARQGDFAALLLYVDEDNVVTITADVEPELSFVIRTSSDEQNLGNDNAGSPSSAATLETPNVCDLGTLSAASVNTCAYRLKVYTNASDGYTVQVDTDGDLSKAGAGDVADIDDIDRVTEGLTVDVGTEAYGVAFNGGAATVGDVTESGDFDDDDTPLPTAAGGPTNLYVVDGPNAPSATDTTNTALVTHRATIDAATAAGHYTQTVTYTVTADF